LAALFYFKIKPNISVKKFIDQITDKYQLKKSKSKKNLVVYLDTFDWRLYRNKMILKYENKSLKIKKFENQLRSYQLELTNLPIFAADIPNSNLKNIVNRIIQVRALQPVAKTVVNRDEYNILDKNEKIILRLYINSFNRIGKYVSVIALRGYERQLKSFTSLIKSAVVRINLKEIFEKILAVSKKIPEDYDPRIKVHLKPEMSSVEATKLILKNLVETLTKNEQGIIDDIDTEFLHDFRVSSRRTRAALTQIKEVFDPEITNQFIKTFALLGKKTNKLRDLDVYLLNKEKYIKRLPINLQKKIEPFFLELKNERNFEHKKLSKFLKSNIYYNQIQNWINFLSNKSINSINALNSNKPVINLAVSFIVKQYNKVMKLGISITPESPDTLYHKLRIQCKKLRYLLEFFSSLFPLNKINLLIFHLKKLQDNLGLFNDLFVQQETLKRYSQKKEFNTEVILALGYLIGKLSDEQIEIRNSFNMTFKEFSNKKTKNLFNDLFISEEWG
jgi:CHAD domain-containing protein